MSNDAVYDVANIHVKKLYLAAKEAEREHGKSLEEVLVELAYTAEPAVAVEAFRIYMAVMLGSGLTLDDLEKETSLATVVSLRDD